jgi:pimeloyl-ACP methyl ester carboxylesterase
MRLVFIHGRAQEGRNPEDVRQEWISALDQGLSKSGLTLPVHSSAITLPYFGDRLFNLTKNLSEIDETAIARGSPMIDPILAFQAAALEDIRKGAGISDAEVQALVEGNATSRGPENWPWVLAVVRAIDKWQSGTSADAIQLLLRDVYVYCTRRGIAEAVEEIVRAEIDIEPTVVVAHSLGTVVAYNILRNDPRSLQVRKLVTVGAPLAIRAVRKNLVPLKSPKAEAWFNAFDPRDIVALNPLNAANFPVVPKIVNKGDVDNFTENRHGIAGYLSDAAVAYEIYQGLVSGSR